MRQDYSYQAVNDESVTSARSIKKGTGSYYTPSHLASLISHDALFRWLSNIAAATIRNTQDLRKLDSSDQDSLLDEIRHVTILDPAVGEGAFLLATADWLRNIRTSLGENDSEKRIRKSIADNCLFGVDLAQHATYVCSKLLGEWVGGGEASKSRLNIRYGNSLVGYVKTPSNEVASTIAEFNFGLYKKLNQRNPQGLKKSLEAAKPFHWSFEFPEVFLDENPGFDIVLGNPPYGNILGEVERRFISEMYSQNVGGGRNGSWNSAAHFLVRAVSLLKTGGQLGFLVPNSFLRVKQFSKIREFLLNHSKLWKIIDEGSPFDNVTLEMISLFCEKTKHMGEHAIQVESRRHGLEQSNTISSSVLRKSSVFPLYHDYIMERILKRGEKYLLVAGRGRDIPKEHVRRKKTSRFSIPYITSGRSVRRYHLNEQYIYYTDDWFQSDAALKESYDNEFLIATKNYRYPRCILKPKGMLHGGGIVKIEPQYDEADLKVLGLILNSKLIQKVSIRYLTNYSQLTCCLNTGIMEELPIVLPKCSQVYKLLFDKLTAVHSLEENHHERDCISELENLADALVYSLYFGDDGLDQLVDESTIEISELAKDPDVVREVNRILSDRDVQKLEVLGTFPASRKSRRY